MSTVTGQAVTPHAAKYIVQLCKHWSHKFQVETTETQGVVHFPTALVTMDALPDALQVRIEAKDADTAEQLKAVVAKHLDRFAFREAPLPFAWG